MHALADMQGVHGVPWHIQISSKIIGYVIYIFILAPKSPLKQSPLKHSPLWSPDERRHNMFVRRSQQPAATYSSHPRDLVSPLMVLVSRTALSRLKRAAAPLRAPLPFSAPCRWLAYHSLPFPLEPPTLGYPHLAGRLEAGAQTSNRHMVPNLVVIARELPNKFFSISRLEQGRTDLMP